MKRKEFTRAIILAGGRGTRLAPYTTVFPKPLMPIGEMPILEIVLRQLKDSGISRVTIAVGYLAELVKTFFGNGNKLGIHIDYSREGVPLGTVGPLTLLNDLNETFILMNGDVLTNLKYKDLIQYHKEKRAILTIATKTKEVKIDLGTIEVEKPDHKIIQYNEKPVLTYQASMGVYVFEPEAINYLIKGEHCDFPELVKRLIQAGESVIACPFSGFWLDIGRYEDYAMAAEIFENNKSDFLPKGEI